jgi:hypothetical protein
MSKWCPVRSGDGLKKTSQIIGLSVTSQILREAVTYLASDVQLCGLSDF